MPNTSTSLLRRRSVQVSTSAQCPFFLKTYTRGECATLVLWFRVELAIKLNKTANGV
ncbi:hypothetical protein [Nostoc sp.]|uniref:hypothetical protein n=1 Tax=Nostoc sp. TaxID=1180 RepID=UPI002FFA473C